MVYSDHLRADFVGQLNEELTAERLQSFSIWFKAVAQHYGPGSDFLDVTHSVAVALWFALNEDEQVEETAVIGPDGPPDPSKDHVVTSEVLRFHPSDAGYLYAFDVAKWGGQWAMAKAGLLVDLAEAPAVFSSSPRMRAQSGCLVYCRKHDGSHLDMRTRLVPGTPIAVGRPMTGTSGLHHRTADIFPSPAVDKWYAKFLSVPLAYAPQPLPPTMRRSIPVTVYSDPPNEQYTQETSYRDVAIPYPLVHRLLEERGLTRATTKQDPYPKLIPILLEAPMMFPYPQGDSDTWHHGLLWNDVPRSCEIYDLEHEEACGEISLLNVLFEFSLLENVGWERLIDEHRPIELLRAVWLRRDGDNFSAAIISETIPVRGPGISEFMPVSYNEQSQQLMFQRTPSGELDSLVPIASEPHIAKPILIALMLLRYLSPALKVEPTWRLRSGNRILVGCARDAARLFQVTTEQSTWFVLRDRANFEEPFTRPTSRAGNLSLEWDKPFRELPLGVFRNALPR
jgi:FRG domain